MKLQIIIFCFMLVPVLMAGEKKFDFEDSCKTDIEKFCELIPNSEKFEMLQCLRYNGSELSDGCYSVLAKRKKKTDEKNKNSAVAASQIDVESYENALENEREELSIIRREQRKRERLLEEAKNAPRGEEMPAYTKAELEKKSALARKRSEEILSLLKEKYKKK